MVWNSVAAHGGRRLACARTAHHLLRFSHSLFVPLRAGIGSRVADEFVVEVILSSDRIWSHGRQDFKRAARLVHTVLVRMRSKLSASFCCWCTGDVGPLRTRLRHAETPLESTETAQRSLHTVPVHALLAVLIFQLQLSRDFDDRALSIVWYTRAGVRLPSAKIKSGLLPGFRM